MEPTKGFYRTSVAGVPYLLTYGQESASGGISLRLNESGSLLWDALCAGKDRDGMTAALAEAYGAQGAELARLRQDVDSFLEQLSACAAVSEEEETPEPAHWFCIGSLVVSYTGDEALFHDSFRAFSCERCSADLSAAVVTRPPARRENGALLVRTPELMICQSGDGWRFLFSPEWGIREMFVRADCTGAVLYVVPDRVQKESVFHALRFAFLLAAQKQGLFALHSASLLYRGKAWLFSGRSGAGKSTHTALWQEQFQTPLLNGDLNLIGVPDGTPTAYGLPWCGTSGICSAQNYPLGGVVLLSQAKENRIVRLPEDEKVLRLMQRLISPAWTREGSEENLRFAETLCGKVPVFALACTKDTEAAQVCKAGIDQLFSAGETEPQN